MPQVWDLGSGVNVPDLLALRDQAKIRQARQGLASMDPNNVGGAGQSLLSAGDTQGGLALLNLDAASKRQAAEDKWRREEASTNRAWREAESGRAQSNADRTFKLAERNSSSRGFDVRTIQHPDGTTSLVRVDLSTGEAKPIDGTAGAGGGGVNPYYTGKFNESQGKAANYADRMAGSHEVINGLEGINNGTGGTAAGIANRVLPDLVTNAFNSADRQKLVQAQRDFLNAILRRESGAAISSSEFANGASQYFPQPNDGPDVLAQKRKNRETAIQGIMREAGPSYSPPKGYVGPNKPPPGGGGGGAPPPATNAVPDPAAVEAEMRRRGLIK